MNQQHVDFEYSLDFFDPDGRCNDTINSKPTDICPSFNFIQPDRILKPGESEFLNVTILAPTNTSDHIFLVRVINSLDQSEYDSRFISIKIK